MKAIRWKVFLEAWGPCLAIYIALLAMTYASAALFSVSFRKATFIPGVTGVVLIPAVLQGYFIGFRNNHYWHEPVFSLPTTLFPLTFRMGLLTAVLIFPCYTIFTGAWSLAIEHRILQGLILTIIGGLLMIGWLWIAKRKVWEPLMAQTPPNGVSVAVSNRHIFRESLRLLIISAIGSACLLVGVMLTYFGTWGMAIVAFAIAIVFAVVTNQMGRRLPEIPPVKHFWRKTE